MLGEVTIEASHNVGFTISETGVDLGAGAGNPIAISLTTGRYADVRVLANDAGANDLASTISCLNGGAGQNYTVSVSDTTGHVTIYASGGHTFAIVWNASLRSIFGFNANINGFTSYTSPSVHKYAFYADRALWWRRINDTELDEAVTVAHDGQSVSEQGDEQRVGKDNERLRLSPMENARINEGVGSCLSAEAIRRKQAH